MSGRRRREASSDCIDSTGKVQREPGGIKELIAYVGSRAAGQVRSLRLGSQRRADRDDRPVRRRHSVDEADGAATCPSRSRAAPLQVVGHAQAAFAALSYGQRRRTLVARAFAGTARVLLLDEVFNGLDHVARAALKQALEQPRSGHDWIMTSHRPNELPANITHVAHIEAGRIVAAGPIEGPGLGAWGGGRTGISLLAVAPDRKPHCLSPRSRVAALLSTRGSTPGPAPWSKSKMPMSISTIARCSLT